MTPCSTKVLDPIAFARLASGGKYQSPPHIRLLQRFVLGILATPGPARGIIQLPVQHGKSHFLSHYFPAWYLSAFPENNVLLTGYGARFAASWGRKARDAYHAISPRLVGIDVAPKQQEAAWWATEKGGQMKSVGTLGPTAGYKSHLWISDDQLKDRKQADSPVQRETIFDWMMSECYTRLRPDGKVILILSRRHEEDPVGRYLQMQEEGGDAWQVLRLPALAEGNDPLGRQEGGALWPGVYSREFLLQKKLNFELAGDEHIWHCLYQQNPIGDPASREWPSEYFADIEQDSVIDPAQVHGRYLSLDPSKGKHKKTGCYSAWTDGTLTKDRHLYLKPTLMIVPTNQVEDTTVGMIRQAWQDDRPYAAVVVEGNSMQDIIARNVKAKCDKENLLCPMYTIVNTEDKISRVRTSLTPLLAQRRVHVLPGRYSRLFVQQHRSFPTGDKVDGPDSFELLTQIINWALRPQQTGSNRVIAVK